MNFTDDCVVLRTEQVVNKEQSSLKRSNGINENLCSNFRSTVSQPAHLYGLAKVQLKGMPLRPVLFLPSSSYENLTKILSKFFDKIEGVNGETEKQKTGEIIENVELDSDENINSLDVKSLFTNIPLKQAIDFELKNLYDQENLQSLDFEEIAKPRCRSIAF